MRPTGTRVVRVRVAEQEGSSGRTQDRVVTTPNAVIVLDGASEPDAGERDGGWFAEVLGNQLAHRLTQNLDDDLVYVLRQAIEAEAVAPTTSSQASHRPQQSVWSAGRPTPLTFSYSATARWLYKRPTFRYTSFGMIVLPGYARDARPHTSWITPASGASWSRLNVPRATNPMAIG